MKISQLINVLNEELKKHGDIDVLFVDTEFAPAAIEITDIVVREAQRANRNPLMNDVVAHRVEGGELIVVIQ